MNEEKINSLKERLLESSEKMIQFVEDSSEFVVEQTPLLIQEILQFYLAANILWGICFLAATSLTAYLMKRFWRTIKKHAEDDLFAWAVGTFILGIAFTMAATTTVNYIINILKITLAPRLYLLEYMKDLL